MLVRRSRTPGPTTAHDHVILPISYFNKLTVKPAETDVLEMYLDPEERTPTSRLGHRVRLTKELEGMVVSVPEAPPAQFDN